MASESKPKPEAKEHREKKAKAQAEEPTAPPKPPPPRQPSDPRLKILKEFQSKLLPRGVLRDRYTALIQRWDSSDDHGGVTVEELKSLFEDRKSAREKSSRRR